MSRKRESKVVLPKGLNHRDTIHSVEDGWCEKLENIAFRGGQLRSVSPHRVIKRVDYDGHSVVYIHPLLPEGHYITVCNGYLCHLVDSNNDGFISSPLVEVGSDSDISVSHFEYHLFVRYTKDGDLKRDSFIYENGVFKSGGIDMVREINRVRISYDYLTPRSINPLEYAPVVAKVTLADDVNGVKSITSFEKYYEDVYADLSESNYIHGAAYLIFGVKMRDGSVIRSSKIYMLNSENGADNSYGTLFKKYEGEGQNIINYCKYIHGYKAQISFGECYELVNNPDVKSIVVYSTRNIPLYDFDNIHSSFPTDDTLLTEYDNGYIGASSKYIFDKRLADALSYPFYELGEVELTNSATMFISAKDYEDIETKTIYQPLVSPHSYIALDGISLNGRWHQYNIVGKPYLPPLPYLEDNEITISHITYHRIRAKSSEMIELGASVTINIGGDEIKCYNKIEHKAYYPVKSITENSVEYEDKPSVIIPNLISYPDIRATKLELFFTRSAGEGVYENVLLGSYELQPAVGNNYAIFRATDVDAINSYRVIPIKDLESNNYQLPSNRDIFKLPNMMMVSNYGMPHIFEPRHIYYIGNLGESEVLNVNIPLDQLTESGFGQLPLYIFTTSGIYAMEQGADTILYQSIIRVNNDIIDSGSNSVNLLGALYYISKGDVRALRGYTSSGISEVLGDEATLFFANAKLYSQVGDGELLVINSNYAFAYVYSVYSKMWSSRTFSGRVLNSYSYISGDSICDFAEDGNNATLTGTMISRELSLGSREVKQLRELEMLITTQQSYTIQLYGSLDGKQWCSLAYNSGCSVIKRRNSSWRWYKLEVRGTNIVIDGALFEFFVKYF